MDASLLFPTLERFHFIQDRIYTCLYRWFGTICLIVQQDDLVNPTLATFSKFSPLYKDFELLPTLNSAFPLMHFYSLF